MTHAARNRKRRFGQAEGGNVAMLGAVLIPGILALACVAIDTQNTLRQKSKVQASLDSAVLAGALQRQRGMTETAVRADVQQYAGSMFAEQGGGLTCAPVTVTFNAESQDIAGSVRCEQPTYLSQLIGQDEMAFTVNATSTYGLGLVDVAFVFDVSGSMNDAGRLPKLKTAAAAAFDELLPEDRARDGSVRLAITSYNHSLNAGPYINAVTDTRTLSADGSNTAARSNYDAYNDERMIDAATGKRFFYYQRGTCTSGGSCGRTSSYTWNTRRYELEDTGLRDSCVYERTGAQAATDAAPASGRWIGAGNPPWNFPASSTNKYDGRKNFANHGPNGHGGGAYDGRGKVAVSNFPFHLQVGEAEAFRMLDQLKLLKVAVSLGGSETLICHSASTTHYAVPPAQRLAGGITDGTIRLSVGLEHVDDLIGDLRQALEAV